MQQEKMGGTPCLLSKAQIAHLLPWALTFVWKMLDDTLCIGACQYVTAGNVCTVLDFSLMLEYWSSTRFAVFAVDRQSICLEQFDHFW